MTDPISLVGLVAGVAQLIDSTRKVVQYCKEIKHAPKGKAMFAQESSSLLSLLISLRDDLKKANENDHWPTALRATELEGGLIDQLSQSLKEVTRKLERPHGPKAVYWKFSWPLEKQEVKDLLVKIDRMKSSIQLVYTRGHRLVLIYTQEDPF